MDGPGTRRALREAVTAGAAAVVVVVCGAVLALTLVTSWLSVEGDSSDSRCWGAAPPDAVVEDRAGREVWGATASRSWLPFGTRCTWTLSDGSTASADPAWGATLGILGVVAVAGTAGSFFARWARRSSRRAARDSLVRDALDMP